MYAMAHLWVVPTSALFAAGFVATALIGLWAAYDWQVALVRLMEVLVGVGLLFGLPALSRRAGSHSLQWAGVGAAGIAGVLGLLAFVLEGRFSGALASTIAVLLPLSMLALGGRWRMDNTIAWLTVFALVIAGAGLLWTQEQSSWSSLVVGILVALLYLLRQQTAPYSTRRRMLDGLLIVSILAVVVGLGELLLFPQVDTLLAQLPLGDSALSRLELWRNTRHLIADYRFTGSGLGSSTMVYSTYVYLLHVPFLEHAHNLYLQIAVEQGVPGLICFLALAVTVTQALFRTDHRPTPPDLRLAYPATVAALATLFVYGLQDAEIYAQGVLPLLFAPLGVALTLLTLAGSLVAHHRKSRSALWIAGSASLALLSLALWPGARAAWHANLGAVAQTKAELRVYHWSTWFIQDEMRRTPQVDLAPAIRHYETALQFDADNHTAHLRLGQIALSRSEYQTAYEHLQRAYATATDEQASRELLGEVDAVRGDLDEAERLWRTIDSSHGELAERLWWHQHLQEQQEAAWIAEVLDRLDESQ
jgi:O-antigen ligase